MKAMVLAAGLGTRLRPLTDSRPKALVEIAGRTLLDITLARLRAVGIRDVIINVHHFADMITKHLSDHDNFGMRVEISREDVLLDTGGGLKKAGYFFQTGLDEPFVLHNVDVLTNIDLLQMVQFHVEKNAVATLAMQDRRSSRRLMFDRDLQLRGRETDAPQASDEWQPLAFCGIHVISPHLLSQLTEDGAFSIISSYLRLAAQGERLVCFRADTYYWRDLGRPEDLRQAEQDFPVLL